MYYLDKNITLLAHAMGVQISFETSRMFIPNSLAEYHSIDDVIYLDMLSILNTGMDPNLSLAHELLHATGHFSRLNRPYFQRLSNSRRDIYDEEAVAQLGAHHLLERLCVESPCSLYHTTLYLQQICKRRNGIARTYEVVESLRAVEYLKKIYDTSCISLRSKVG